MINNVITPVITKVITSVRSALEFLGLASFNPASLFVGGYTGGWYDPSDLSTMFTTSTGNVSVTTSGDPVGLMLDKSQTLGSEILLNGGFDTDNSNWTLVNGTFSVTGGVITLTNAATRAVNGQSFTTVIGQQYRVTSELIDNMTSGFGAAIVRVTSTNSFGGTILLNLTSPNPDNSRSKAMGFFVATGTTTYFWVANNVVTPGLAVGFGGVSVKADNGNAKLQATAGQRQLYQSSGLQSTLADGIDDNFGAVLGGASTTAFCFMACVKPTQVGVRQTLFSDVGTNTGYKVELNTSNQLVISAGNGTSYTSATTSDTFTNGQVVSIEAYDDGTNLGVCLNNGTPVTVARPTVAAGTATFTLGKDNGAASGYFKGDVYGELYNRNKGNTPTERANAITYLRAKGGI